MGSFITEADIKINSRYVWAATVATCKNRQELIEPTVTHEVGHVYGLGHVGERKHPLLTMSTASDGPCNNAASTLGLGDMKGLEALY
jgi:predicted Zn-dependent protease